MPSFLSEYLSPTNPIAIIIVRILQYSFLIWLSGLLIYGIYLLVRYIQIRKNQDVQMLVDAQKGRDVGSENNDQKPEPENIFREFCKKDSLDDGYPLIKYFKAIFLKGYLDKGSSVAKHIKAIFLAGWNESRLEVGELINHTTSNLFKWNNLFRSILAVFIIIGLLGTLFGLTDSLTELSPALNENAVNETSTDNSNGMTKVLSELFDTIKGAFAPSILGIIFTILGVIIYGIFLRSACHPIKSILEQVTLTIWVPQLYPTTSQKLIQTLHESEAQMRSGYQTAAQVGELVENVQGNISEFNENLKRANAITKPLSDSASQINAAASQINSAADVLNRDFTESIGKFSQEFSENVNRLTGFQDEIRSLHQEFQASANQKLDEQTQTLKNVFDTLKIYEETYVKSREQIDETLQNFINVATDANTSIHEQNREWFEQINSDNKAQFFELQGQLKEKLTELQQTLKNELKTISGVLTDNLKNVQGSLNERLETLTGRLENFDTPLKEAVEQIQESFDKQLETLNNRLENFDEPLREAVEKIRETFDTQLETLNNRLENFDEPLKQTAENMSGTFANLVRYMQTIVGDLQREIKEQNEKYGEQLTGVENLNESVKNLLSQLDESSSNQKNALDELSTNINGLTTDINNLDSAIKTFTSDSGTLSQSIATIEGHVKTLGTASQQLVTEVEKANVTPLTASIKELNTSVNEISQHSKTLADAVNTLLKQGNQSGSKRKRKGPFRGGKWNPFNRKKTSGQSSKSQTNNEGE